MPQYCLVKHRISTYVIDSADPDRNPDRIPVTGTVTFEALLDKGDAVVITEGEVATTITLAPIEAHITNGEIYHRGEEGVKLFAGGSDTNPERIRYLARFSNLIAGGKRIDLKNILFEAVPGGELTLSMAQPVPGKPYPGYSATIEQGITQISDAAVSYLDQIEGARDEALGQVGGAVAAEIGGTTHNISTGTADHANKVVRLNAQGKLSIQTASVVNASDPANKGYVDASTQSTSQAGYLDDRFAGQLVRLNNQGKLTITTAGITGPSDPVNKTYVDNKTVSTSSIGRSDAIYAERLVRLNDQGKLSIQTASVVSVSDPTNKGYVDSLTASTPYAGWENAQFANRLVRLNDQGKIYIATAGITEPSDPVNKNYVDSALAEGVEHEDVESARQEAVGIATAYATADQSQEFLRLSAYAHQLILDQAIIDGWDAVYDPGNPTSRTIEGGRVSGITDGLGNRAGLTQADSAARPALLPRRFGALAAAGDGHFASTDAFSGNAFIMTVADGEIITGDSTLLAGVDGVWQSTLGPVLVYDGTPGEAVQQRMEELLLSLITRPDPSRSIAQRLDTAASVAVMDEAGNLVYGQGSALMKVPASTLKTMTSYVARRTLTDDQLGDMAQITVDALGNPRTGDPLPRTVSDLFHSSQIESGNPAAYTLAEIVGTELLAGTPGDPRERFLQEMHTVGESLGWSGNIYVDPSGNGINRTTAWSMADLMRRITDDDPWLLEVMNKTSYTLSGGENVNSTTTAAQRALLPGWIGGKTGTLLANQECLIGSWVAPSGKRFSAAVLAAATGERYTDMNWLINYTAQL